MKSRLLVVDDHEEIVDWLVEELEREGYDARGCTSSQAAASLALEEDYDLVIADVEMPAMRGPELMAEIHKRRPGQLVLLITAFGSVDLAVRLVREGACDFVTKPFTIEALLLAIERSLHERQMRREIVRTRTQAPPESPRGLVARSESMRRALSRAQRAARVSSSVLLTGETGVGKGTIAQYLHGSSPRSGAPFVHINCAGIPTSLMEGELFGVRRGAYTDAHHDREGLFVRANGGTLFLDEVGELPLESQPKLLDVLETGRVRPLGGSREQTVDVRIIAATNRDLSEAVAQRTFRADLLFRLDVIRIEIPPLRERIEDIEALVDLFVDRFSARLGRPVMGVSRDALLWLQAQPWPGNVRELANVIEQAVALGEHDAVTIDDLYRQPARSLTSSVPSESLSDAIAAGLPLEELERSYMRRMVEACGGNMSEAARRLGVDRRTLYRRLSE